MGGWESTRARDRERRQQEVEKCFGKNIGRGANPDEVVALGAALQGQALTADDSTMLLLDVTPLSLGIATVGGKVSQLIPKNTTIPTQKKHSFTTVHENQSAVKIVVLQGEAEEVSGNKLLGEFLLSGIRPAPAGVPDIEVLFEIDADGIVSVTARDKDTGKEQSITVAVSGGLSDDDINRLIEQREEFEVDQKQDETAGEARYEVESLHRKVMDLLPAAEASIAGDDLHTIMDVLAAAKTAMNSRDAVQLEASKGQLAEVYDSLREYEGR